MLIVVSRVTTHGRLEFMGQNQVWAAYMEKPFVHTYMYIPILHEDGRLLGKRFAMHVELYGVPAAGWVDSSL